MKTRRFHHHAKSVGVYRQALDHPPATVVGPHGTGPLLPEAREGYRRETGSEVLEDLQEREPCNRLFPGDGITGREDAGGDIDLVLGRRVTVTGFPVRREKGEGSIVRLMAMVEE